MTDSVSAEKESERKREIRFNGQSGELWEESTEQFLRSKRGGDNARPTVTLSREWIIVLDACLVIRISELNSAPILFHI